MALIFASSEIEETIGLCDRVKIMYRGQAIREFSKGEATKADVTYWVSGGDSTALLTAATSELSTCLINTRRPKHAQQT